jgi:pyrroloquinoline quinone (PQQ) biosynthesis protein C
MGASPNRLPPIFLLRCPASPHSRQLVQAEGQGALSSLARTREMQEACVAAVEFKCDVLWAQLDALYLAYVVGMVPPSAYRMA